MTGARGRPINELAQGEGNEELNAARNEAAVRKLFASGFNRGELSLLDELFDPAFVEHQSLPPGVPPTTAAVRAIILALRSGFSDLDLRIETLDAVGDRVWARLLATGTHDGPFMGSPPTGRRLSVTVFDLVRFKNGKIMEHWGVPDNLAAMAQLGLLSEEK